MTVTQRKCPDTWAVSREKLYLLVLEFTRSNDSCKFSVHDTDTFKTAMYTPLRNSLVRLIPEWDLDMQTYTFGI